VCFFSYLPSLLEASQPLPLWQCAIVFVLTIVPLLGASQPHPLWLCDSTINKFDLGHKNHEKTEFLRQPILSANRQKKLTDQQANLVFWDIDLKFVNMSTNFKSVDLSILQKIHRLTDQQSTNLVFWDCGCHWRICKKVSNQKKLTYVRNWYYYFGQRKLLKPPTSRTRGKLNVPATFCLNSFWPKIVHSKY
jgi:hypothetical protein